MYNELHKFEMNINILFLYILNYIYLYVNSFKINFIKRVTKRKYIHQLQAIYHFNNSLPSYLQTDRPFYLTKSNCIGDNIFTMCYKMHVLPN